jgi:hypothetical protein
VVYCITVGALLQGDEVVFVAELEEFGFVDEVGLAFVVDDFFFAQAR